MHLLFRTSTGALGVQTFYQNIPKYAILSHRWVDDKPTFQDMSNETGKRKAGYGKLIFCEKQAAQDGLKYFWVDTVCIDKTSSAELSEAINSMFRWYQEASKCYAYLSDVTRVGSGFGESQWFKRGWTLQELLAPKTVEFFSSNGDKIGDKVSLQDSIKAVTGIPVAALRGRPMSDFTVAERMLWVRTRVTTREEDKAYCLMGIFNVFMPVIYGEGNRQYTTPICLYAIAFPSREMSTCCFNLSRD